MEREKKEKTKDEHGDGEADQVFPDTVVPFGQHPTLKLFSEVTLVNTMNYISSDLEEETHIRDGASIEPFGYILARFLPAKVWGIVPDSWLFPKYLQGEEEEDDEEEEEEES